MSSYDSVLINDQNFDVKQSGMIFTRREVADFILDLVGYVPDKSLWQYSILEPSSGGGSFLLPIIDRLLVSWKKLSDGKNLLTMCDAIRAVELNADVYYATRECVLEHLAMNGFPLKESSLLTDKWLLNGDFLMEEFSDKFNFIVGNPPYVRQELIPDYLLLRYRKKYHTMYDRSDLYIPFIENSLKLLADDGRLGFICADRWMKNRYGRSLRSYVSEYFNLDIYVDMVGRDAFLKDVSAYPAVVVFSRNTTGITRVARCPEIENDSLKSLASELVDNNADKNGETCSMVIRDLTHDDQPWLIETAENLNLINKIKNKFYSLEKAGCKVGIGVATGADKIFVIDYASLKIEMDRKIPLLTTKDILTGEIDWLGKGVINPFDDTEHFSLVNLDDFPLLKNYLENHKELLLKRHCAKNADNNWYRTIDRITPALTKKPKLLIPDIKGHANVVYDPGKFYPHHNLYYILSDEWDLIALRAVLLSDLVRMFIKTYTTKMRGGYLRFQAQYLRRICIPKWDNVEENIRQELFAASLNNDIAACNAATNKLYGLSDDEIESLAKEEW
ncbi:MAG: Eco57I restriction-modification methylase domain-containing protein [Synergistaceae bacterium]|jgi:hypothetical protein|nr:Eco57I restriction-modification methylase domain-containing protein [Synergistaceae bacterium]